MEITWLGYSCFRLKGKQTAIITDPLHPDNTCYLNRVSADIVTLSVGTGEEPGIEKIGGQPYIIHGPGEYEVRSVLIIGIASYQDEARGSIRGKNTIYAMDMEDVSICHLGKLGHLLNDEAIEAIGNVDILLVPVGGNITIDAAQAARLVRTIEPKIVIPMHFKTASMDSEFEPVEKFLTEIGSQGLVSQPKLNISKNSLPQSMQVIVLGPPA